MADMFGRRWMKSAWALLGYLVRGGGAETGANPLSCSGGQAEVFQPGGRN